MPARLFTVEEAEALLPRLERTFREVRALREEIDRRMDQVRILDVLWGERIREASNPDHQEWVEHDRRVREAVTRLEALVEEGVLGLGVRFPQGGLEWGLVDFPTWFEDRVVYLCWRSGEASIQAWHEVDAGFRGRRPLTAEEARRMGPEPGAGEGGDREVGR